MSDLRFDFKQKKRNKILFKVGIKLKMRKKYNLASEILVSRLKGHATQTVVRGTGLVKEEKLTFMHFTMSMH